MDDMKTVRTSAPGILPRWGLVRSTPTTSAATPGGAPGVSASPCSRTTRQGAVAQVMFTNTFVSFIGS
jgi:hypothetical protein